jgi:hypothetical protein
MLAKNADAISIAVPSEQGSDGSLVETCDLVESALAKKINSTLTERISTR